MYTPEGVSSSANFINLLFVKSLNKTEPSIVLYVMRSLFPKAVFLTFISIRLMINDVSLG